MLGYSNAEILSSPDIRQYVYKEDLPLAMQKVELAVKEEKPINVVYRCMCKNGELVLSRLDAKIMLTDDMMDDDVAVLYAVHSKLTDESKLAMQEQEYYRMILDMTETAYFEWDKINGFYASDNYKEYAISNGGYSSILGSEEGRQEVHPEDIAALQQFFKQISEPGCPNAITVRMKMQDGHYQRTEIRSYFEQDESGNYSKLVGVLRDVDKEWNEQNRKLQSALDAAQQANRQYYGCCE